MFESSKSVKSIFYINLLVFIVTLIFPGFIYQNFAMYNIHSDNFHLYQLITYQFLHGGFLHILFNMLVFLSFGPFVEDFYGSRNLWTYYLICGVSSCLLQEYMVPSDIALVGASGSIWGIMVLFVFLYPNEKVMLFFIPYGIKAKYIISILFLIELLTAFTSSGGNVANFGHIGGAIMGGIIYFYKKFKK